MKWLHRLLNPHCEHCALEQQKIEESSIVTFLRFELEKAQREKEKLLERLLEKPELEPVTESKEFKPIQKTMSWPQRRAILEAESRAALKIQQDKVKELEEATGVESAS